MCEPIFPLLLRGCFPRFPCRISCIIFLLISDARADFPQSSQDWSTCTACGRRISYEVVDQMLPSGPPIDDDGNMPGNTGTWGGQPTEPYRRLYQVRHAEGFVFGVFQCAWCLLLLPDCLHGIPALRNLARKKKFQKIESAQNPKPHTPLIAAGFGRRSVLAVHPRGYTDIR